MAKRTAADNTDSPCTTPGNTPAVRVTRPAFINSGQACPRLIWRLALHAPTMPFIKHISQPNSLIFNFVFRGSRYFGPAHEHHSMPRHRPWDRRPSLGLTIKTILRSTQMRTLLHIPALRKPCANWSTNFASALISCDQRIEFIFAPLVIRMMPGDEDLARPSFAHLGTRASKHAGPRATPERRV